MFDQIRKDSLHHAYLIEGDAATADAVCTHLEAELGISVVGNTEVTRETFDVFGIDDARALFEREQRKTQGEYMIFVLTLTRITGEAEQALLKLFEDTPARTHFFLVVPFVDALSPTVRSRCAIIRRNGSQTQGTFDVAHFLAQPFGERLAFVETIVDDASTVDVFLNTLEYTLATHITNPEVARALVHIGAVRESLRMRGSSTKQLLESVALLVPDNVSL